jgi:SAM-dependent methyltransferase
MLRRFLKDAIVMPAAVAIYRGRPLAGVRRYIDVVRDLRRYRQLASHPRHEDQADGCQPAWQAFSPWLLDNEAQAGRGDEYFYQDTWCVQQIARLKPQRHVDVGSALLTMGVVAQFTPVLYVDYRPLTIHLHGFTTARGDLLALPFRTGSIASLSCLSVVEHVGLGRYGDRLDPSGTRHACEELARVTAPGGRLYVAVPTARTTSVVFNAHRIFAPQDFLAFFPGLQLLEEQYALATRLVTRQEYDQIGRPYAYGCFCFTSR